MNTIICARCGLEVPQTGRSQKYCPECSKALTKERDRIRRYRPPPKRTIKLRPNKTLTDLNAEARAMGMTYGRYVAAYGR